MSRLDPALPRRAVALVSAMAMAASCAGLLDLDGLHYDDAVGSTTGSAGTSTGQAGQGGATASTGGVAGNGGGGAGGTSGTAGAGGSCPPAPGGGGAPSAGVGGFAACDPTAASSVTEFAGCPSCVADVNAASDAFDGSLEAFCTMERDSDPDGAIVIDGGKLRIVTSCSAWNTVGFGPFVYRRITGDFAVVTQVLVDNGLGQQPSAGFHGAGLLVRKPKSPPGGAGEEHLLFSMGHLASELGGGAWLTTAGSTNGIGFPGTTTAPHRLGICRVGGDFHLVLYDTQWFELNESPVMAPQLAADAELEVGVTAHAYSGGQLVDAEFEFLSFGEVIDADCLATVAALAAAR
jgi:hypothetical protein